MATINSPLAGKTGNSMIEIDGCELSHMTGSSHLVPSHRDFIHSQAELSAFVAAHCQGGLLQSRWSIIKCVLNMAGVANDWTVGWAFSRDYE